MAFKEFQASIKRLLKKNGLDFKPVFFQDEEKGQFVAVLPGVRITSNPQAKRVCCDWGSGHRAFAEIGG